MPALTTLPVAQIKVLEALTLVTCPAQEQVRIGNWVLRASDSKVMRANTVTVFAGDNLTATQFAQRLQFCVAWYAQRDKKSHFRISAHPAAMAVDRALAGLDYVQYDSTQVMHIANLSAIKPHQFSQQLTLQAIDVGQATQWRMITRGEPLLTALAEADAARAYASGHGYGDVGCGGHAVQSDTLESWLENMIDSSAPQSPALARNTHAFALVDAKQNLIASGIARTCGVHVGLFSIYTAPSHRGQGCGAAITQALLQWAQCNGATAAFLQVEASNAAAIRLYASLGFVAAYSYHYRKPI